MDTKPAAGAPIEAIAKDGRKTRASVPADADRVTLEFPAVRRGGHLTVGRGPRRFAPGCGGSRIFRKS